MVGKVAHFMAPQEAERHQGAGDKVYLSRQVFSDPPFQTDLLPSSHHLLMISLS